MTDPGDPRPATDRMLNSMKPILSAPRSYRLIALMWWTRDGQWVYLPGWWHDDWGRWVADPVLTGGYDLPSVVSHWAEL
jgi:hypothetical protein